jgi:hypothetical protein
MDHRQLTPLRDLEQRRAALPLLQPWRLDLVSRALLDVAYPSAWLDLRLALEAPVLALAEGSLVHLDSVDRLASQVAADLQEDRVCFPILTSRIRINFSQQVFSHPVDPLVDSQDLQDLVALHLVSQVGVDLLVLVAGRESIPKNCDIISNEMAIASNTLQRTDSRSSTHVYQSCLWDKDKRAVNLQKSR